MPIQVHQMDRTLKETLDVTKTLEAQSKESKEAQLWDRKVKALTSKGRPVGLIPG